MKVLKNHFVKNNNTFKINAKVNYWVEYDSVEDLRSIFELKELKSLNFYCIGLGANILITKDFEGFFLHSNIDSLFILEQTDTFTKVKVGSGLLFDDFVKYSLEHSWYGLENLSGIPSSVGASVIQNIGAYGVEVANYVDSVVVFDTKDKKIKTISGAECSFGYRDSIFKKEQNNHFVICYVVYKLNKKFKPKVDYGSLEKDIISLENLKALDLRDIVLNVRNSKLPDYKKIGNAGSYFKNPVIDKVLFDKIKVSYPELKGWEQRDGRYKISAAFLIDKAGWKDKRIGSVGTYPKQPLVLINYGDAKATEIVDFADRISIDVYEKFKIKLSPEVIYK